MGYYVLPNCHIWYMPWSQVFHANSECVFRYLSNILLTGKVVVLCWVKNSKFPLKMKTSTLCSQCTWDFLDTKKPKLCSERDWILRLLWYDFNCYPEVPNSSFLFHQNVSILSFHCHFNREMLHIWTVMINIL